MKMDPVFTTFIQSARAAVIGTDYKPFTFSGHVQHDNKEASESKQTMAQNPNLIIVDDQLLTKEQDDLLYGTVNPMVTRMAVADPAQYWPRTTTAFPIVFYSFHSSVTDSERNLI